jgi:hypothetical protein
MEYKNYFKGVCKECGEIFYKRSKGIFCGHGCYGKWKSKNFTGERAPVA